MNNPKTVLITGATSGLGLESAKDLVLRGYNVIGTSRSTDKEKHAIAYIGKKIPFIQADLTSLKNLRMVAEKTKELVGKNGLDVLLNNAGTFYSHHALSADGLEKQFAVNTIAPLYLSLLLYDDLKKANGRIVNVSSNSHYNTSVRWKDIQLSRNYSQLKAYKQTKLFSVMLSREFNKASKLVKIYMADPGLVNTDMGFKNTNGLAQLLWKHRKKKGQSVAKGAETSIYLATKPQLSGFYFKYSQPKKPSKKAMDNHLSQKIWAYCLNVINLDVDKILGDK